MAFAALTALKLAQHDGLTGSSEQAENLFLVRWLKTALKQKRFHRCVSADLLWLSDLGQQRMMTAKLRHRLDYLWKSCCCDVQDQSALFRLTYATEMLKNLGWISEVQNTGLRHKVRKNISVGQGKQVFYVTRDALNEGFDDAGNQVRPVEFFVDGNAEQFESVMIQHQFYGQFADSDRILYRLIPA
ncbi:hypothetical protein X965_10915 [Morganella sp. EGD-HP17]|nr:hypothetical protein X965_10915 [Morganella sp. EGD-HP17]